jgi:mannose-6-phosphate isomerase-like protein (cupin superfamily)
MKTRTPYLSAAVLLATSVFLILAIGTSSSNISSALAQQGGSSSNSNGGAPADTTTMSNRTTSATAVQQQESQNQTRTCAPQFNGTMTVIPRPNEAATAVRVGQSTTTAVRVGQSTTTNSTLIVDIMSLAKQNTCYRAEFKTANHTQVVLMSLKPGEEIGLEIHRKIDQLLVFVQGSGMANISGQSYPVKAGDLVFVPAGTVHNFVNTGNTDLKLFTMYSPPNHLPGTLQKTKADEKGYVPQGAIEEEG